jgi:DNA polymerase III subunit beta
VKFRCERDALAEAIGTAARAVSSRTGAHPALSGLRVTAAAGALELVGSDTELTIRAHAPADTQLEGVAVLPRLFGDVVRALEPGTVTVEADGDEARITAGRSSFSLRLLPADDFPRVAGPAGEGVRVEARVLAEALRQVVPAASRDDARPILTGVLLTSASGGLRLVATDSYRLAVRDVPGVTIVGAGQKVLVAARALGEVQRLLGGEGDIEVVLGDQEVTFRVERVEVTSRIIPGDFPNYEQLIPSGYPNRLTVSRDALVEAVKRMRLVGQGRDNAPVRLSMGSEGLELSAIAQDVGEARETLDAKFEGTDLTVAFNSEFLLHGVEAPSSEEVVLETLDPLKPATLRGAEGGDLLYLLMPVRIT